VRRLLLATILATLTQPAWAAPRPDEALSTGCGLVAYGVGRGGTNTGTLSGIPTDPSPGHVLSLEMQGFSFGPAAGGVFFSPDQALLPMFGGTLLVDPTTIVLMRPVQYDVFAVTSVTIPNDASLVGARVHAQTGLVYPVTGIVELSNGLTITICP